MPSKFPSSKLYGAADVNHRRLLGAATDRITFLHAACDAVLNT